MRIGIDVGGTKIEGIALGPAGETRVRRRIAAPRGDYHATIQAIAELVTAIEAETAGRGSVGIGIPGTISAATGLVKNSNSTWLNGRPLGQDVTARLARPVRFANDANCFALSETTDGAAQGARSVFGVIVGTGTGGGVVIDGKVLVGANAIAGEWGHNPLPWPRAGEWPGPPCYCGRAGCIEQFLSGPALSRDFSKGTAGWSDAPPVDAAEIVTRAATGDLHAELCLDRYEDRFARALASVINLLDPAVIVLGGGLSNIERLYTTIPARWAAYIFSDVVATRLVRATHGDSSGVRGAAWLWNEAGDDPHCRA
ncbi:MAG TPA: ROK family protein [Vicinamibacterales bacterium]|nr:ROK family protein [Vicinamibacterales bacterium]